MDRDVENGYVISGYGSMNSHTDFQQNGSKSLIYYIDNEDTDMNATLKNIDTSSGIGLLSINTLPQYNESSHLNEINMGD